MRKFFLLIVFVCISSSFAQNRGRLMIIGGGDRPDYMMNRFIEYAGGRDAKIIIVPNASGDRIGTAEYQVEQFKNLGVENVDYIDCTKETADADSNLAKLENVSGIFFSGGDQSRLTRDFLGSKFLEKIRELYSNGAILGGTSAGAAIMSKVMLTGNELANSDSSSAYHTIQKNNIETVEGFGFVTKAVIDQHFIKRKRNNRLLSVILEHPDLLGIGIDEATCIIVNPDDTFEVLGENQVIVYDATEAVNISTDKNNNLSGSNLKLHILSSGEKFDLNSKKLIQ